MRTYSNICRSSAFEHAAGRRVTTAASASVMIICIGGPSAVQAEPYWEQYEKLTAPAALPDDYFGDAIATDGVLALFGASGDSREVDDAGAVHVFEIASRTFVRRMTAAVPAFRERFGTAIAYDGRHAVIGAPGATGPEWDSGVAYVVDPATGNQLHRLMAGDGDTGDRFGHAVAVDGQFLVIGAYNADPGDVQTGAAYVFDTRTGEQLHRLVVIDEETGLPDLSVSRLGWSVALRGELVAVGAPDAHVPRNGFSNGAVMIFDVNSGNYLRRIEAPNTADDFGLDVDIEGERILIGAGRQSFDNRRRGGAHLYDLPTGAHLQLYTPNNGWNGQGLGSTVDLQGDHVLLGAQAAEPFGPGSGAAWLFDTGSGSQLAFLVATDGAAEDRFGRSFALIDGRALIGASGHDDPVQNGGAVYIFGAPIADDLTIEPSPLVSDAPATFRLANMRPSERTWMLYSLDGVGSGIWVRELGVIVDLDRPEIAWGPTVTSPDGTLTVEARMPVIGSNVEVWFQAIQEIRTTNVVETSIVLP